MKPAVQFLLLLSAGTMCLSIQEGRRQATSKTIQAGPPVVIEYYYALVPGAKSEWLALYKKNHNPILVQLMKDGLLTREKLYERRFHARSPAWDYKVVLAWCDWSALEEARSRESDIVRRLYPNQDEHARQEKRRWELTVANWDDVLSEIPLE